MKDGERLGLEQMRAFLEASEEVGFKAADQREVYGWTERTLCEQEYMSLSKSGKGLVKRYVGKVTGLSVFLNQALPQVWCRRHEFCYRKRRA
jgi:hypothetical protein